ncbi:hypothetical protein [Methylobacterium radiotolerans]|uniref:hypothetical protein n=1 Tax=Methylobacterium radiotolerans TaxID=31998 RepID=UPI003391FF62
MAYTPEQQAALQRLLKYYNATQPYNPNTNPGGLRNGGHRTNFVPALQDVALIAQLIGVVLDQGTADSRAAQAAAEAARDNARGQADTATTARQDAQTARDASRTAQTGI